MEHIEIPEKIPSVISDFTRDLSLTFPEYSHLWCEWTNTEQIDTLKMKALIIHLANVFPERFFDILYQNEDIFKPIPVSTGEPATHNDGGSSSSNSSKKKNKKSSKEKGEKGEKGEKQEETYPNVEFLPGVDFRILWNLEDVSETTKTAIWKYLQLILVNILGSVKNKMSFGDTANLFEGVDEKALQEKLTETIDGISDFFHHLGVDETGEQEEEDFVNVDSDGNETGDSGQNRKMPSSEELHEHLNGLFNGKIGSLAKELAEEISTDMQHLFQEEGTNDVKTTQDLLKKMMRNPKKIMEIMKTIGDKLNKKMKDGDINEEDIMKEASDILGKMKGMGGLGGKEGMGQFADLLKTMGKGMGMDTKNMKMNMGALGKMQNKFMTKERMMQKLEQRRAMRAEMEAQRVLSSGGGVGGAGSTATQHEVKYHINSISETPAHKNMVFSIDGEEQQTCSYEETPKMVEENLDDLVNAINGIGCSESEIPTVSKSMKKKNKNKKK